MSFFAVLLALLIEQVRPLPARNWVHTVLTRWVSWAGNTFDAGKPVHARVVWAITVLVPTLAALALHVLLVTYVSVVLAFVFNVVVLYFTLGFRQFSHHFTDVRKALERGEDARARELLSQWLHLDGSELPRTELLRHVIERALLAAHSHVFGVFFCFVVLAAAGAGPAGAVLYRMAEFTSRYWGWRSRRQAVVTHERLFALAQRAFGLIDHIPARLTAFGFAAVGNFEEAVASWRRNAALWARPNEGVVLAAAAGAVNVRLGASAEATTDGAEPELAHLASVVGLVWRCVLLWMSLLFTFTVFAAVVSVLA